MLYNFHTHTLHSHDSAAIPEEICEAACARGLSGVAFTDHCDCEYTGSTDVAGRIAASLADARAMRRRFAGRLEVFAGVEMGDALFDLPFARRLLAETDFDVVLASVHAVRFPGADMPFSVIDFSNWDKETLQAYMRQYFRDLSETMDAIDFDILSHLTVPLRYIDLKYGKGIGTKPFRAEIDGILKKTVEMGKTLELNTSGAGEDPPFFMPDEEILRRYLALGGRSIALGSDAHTAENVAQGLEQGAELLQKLGVTTGKGFLER